MTLPRTTLQFFQGTPRKFTDLTTKELYDEAKKNIEIVYNKIVNAKYTHEELKILANYRVKSDLVYYMWCVIRGDEFIAVWSNRASPLFTFLAIKDKNHNYDVDVELQKTIVNCHKQFKNIMRFKKYFDKLRSSSTPLSEKESISEQLRIFTDDFLENFWECIDKCLSRYDAYAFLATCLRDQDSYLYEHCHYKRCFEKSVDLNRLSKRLEKLELELSKESAESKLQVSHKSRDESEEPVPQPYSASSPSTLLEQQREELYAGTHRLRAVAAVTRSR